MDLHVSRAVQDFYLVRRTTILSNTLNSASHFKNRLPNVLRVFERVRRFKGDAAWFADSTICQNELKTGANLSALDMRGFDS
jgi:hypothetical protein